tara:strand:- start:3347 stop:3550 length:204 start_codon:yes stop_codon:yes gene_type:complete
MSEDWRYTEERMNLRQEVFLALKKYNTLSNVRFLYEFCHDWVSQGNQSVSNCEQHFLQYREQVATKT